MDLIIGDKGQAVDEHGRWEEGSVVSADAETRSFCVKFAGWGEKFNRLVSKMKFDRYTTLFMNLVSA